MPLHEDIVSFLRLLTEIVAIQVQRAVRQHSGEFPRMLLRKPVEGHAAPTVIGGVFGPPKPGR